MNAEENYKEADNMMSAVQKDMDQQKQELFKQT